MISEWLLLTAANFLLAEYLTNQGLAGPFRLFDAMRYAAGIRPVTILDMETGQEEDTGVLESDGSFLAEVLSCPLCTSPYTAFGLILLSLLVGFTSPSWTAIILWLAVTGASVLIFEIMSD